MGVIFTFALYFPFIFVCIYWYQLSQNLVLCAFKENAFFGMLMLAYLQLNSMWLCKLFRCLGLCIKKLTSRLVIKTIYLCLLHLKAHHTASVIARFMFSLPSEPVNSAALHCAGQSCLPILFSLSLLNEIFTCLSPFLRRDLSLMVLNDSSYSC